MQGSRTLYLVDSESGLTYSVRDWTGKECINQQCFREEILKHNYEKKKRKYKSFSLTKVFPFLFLHKHFYIFIWDDSYKVFLQDLNINLFNFPSQFVVYL